jgi:hypothetical protein
MSTLAPQYQNFNSPYKDHWNKGGRSQGHCGYCLPCLIRRASLAGIDTTTYTLDDLKAAPLDTRHAEGRQVRSFQLAIDRLAKRPSLATALIHKPGPLFDDPTRQPALAAVYLRGMQEVGRLLAGVRTEAL